MGKQSLHLRGWCLRVKQILFIMCQSPLEQCRVSVINWSLALHPGSPQRLSRHVKSLSLSASAVSELYEKVSSCWFMRRHLKWRHTHSVCPQTHRVELIFSSSVSSLGFLGCLLCHSWVTLFPSSHLSSSHPCSPPHCCQPRECV